MMYLLYSRSGREFEVEADLREMGIDVWCGRVLEGRPDPKRAGRKRPTIWTERPVLPNYIFADLTEDEFQDTRDVKHIIGFVTAVHDGAAREVDAFRNRVEKAHRDAQRARERGEMAPPTFTPNQALEVIGGPLSGLMVNYRRIVEDAQGLFSVEVDTAFSPVRVNPADVKAAE